MNDKNLKTAYEIARERYGRIGVDVEAALKKLEIIPIFLHCWQGDDVSGFETAGATLSGGGIQATGNHPGKARTIAELQSDLEKALSLIPGRHRLNLHASYLDNGGKNVDRNEIEPRHFQGWIEHGIACRRVGAEMGTQLGSPTVTNVWIPDGYKGIPVDRGAPRERLLDSLDRIFEEPLAPPVHLDAVEAKLFGIGAESYTVGSAEFYMGYAASRRKLLTLDGGHDHPTEVISEKISSVLMFCPGVLLHVSRPVRWDSDHVVILDDELLAIAHELVRSGQFGSRAHVGLDYFDASINRVAAWVIGTRNMVKALLIALLEPTDALRDIELKLDYTHRPAVLEKQKGQPWSAVWDVYCARKNVPVRMAWFDAIRRYERGVLSRRGN